MTNEELLYKWESVLDYTDENNPPLSGFKRLYCAINMENMEKLYPDVDLLKIIIPQIRRNGGPLESVEINNKIYYKRNVDDDVYAFELDNHLGDCYVWRDGEWKIY